ncbi:MAG: N-acetyltransferase [Solirubrobacterales bacterium]|nr:N-acetyltransferase [Solirubrobacterales bacterium]MBV9915507.1 N-acetyltransferase [Solirubrobacterales bacterium]
MEIVELRSGRMVHIRPIRADDGARLNEAYERLSPESKYRRFLGVKPRLTSSDTRYLVQVDGRDHVALVATPLDDPESIIAVARFIRSEQDSRAAEWAIVVGDPYQQEGLATALLERLARAAAERGITRFKATMLADNGPAHRLVRSLAPGATRERHLGTVDEIEVELAS